MLVNKKLISLKYVNALVIKMECQLLVSDMKIKTGITYFF